MIFYHHDLGTHFKRFGINLPLRDDRPDRVFATLKGELEHLEPVVIEEIEKLTLKDLSLAHSEDLVRKWENLELLKEELKRTYDNGGDPRDFEALSLTKVAQFRDHILLQGGATLKALELSLSEKERFVFFLGGGMHHARKDFGSGFCPIQDLVIAMRKCQQAGKIKRGLIIDVDAHMGDGTSEVTFDDETIDTMSLHMAKAWPFECELSITPSTYDVGFLPGEEETYLSELEKGLASFDERDYDALIVVAGADPHEKDILLSTQDMKLTKEQLLARDLMIYQWAKKKGLPQLWVMAGGYGDEAHSIYSQFLLEVLKK